MALRDGSFTTACPRNCYSTCTITVQIEDGRLRRVLPHAGNRATAGGPCLKGLAYVERVASPDRIVHPLRRRPDGTFGRVGWDEALDEIAAELRRAVERDGPRSLFYYAGSGTKGLLNSAGPAFFRMLGGYTGIYGDLCWPAGLEATRLTLGDNRHSAPWDLANARGIVFWGKNPAETNIHQMPFVEEALAAGGRMVVIDPRRTQTAERAELLVQPRPGSDGALAMAVAHVLFRDGLVDRDFLAAHVTGWEAYEAKVAACTPQWAEGPTGVAARHTERLARTMGVLEPLTICAGYGMQRWTNGGQTIRAILALAVLTGNVGKPGGGWQYANLQSAVFDEVKDPLALYPPEEPDGVARIAVSTARLGRDMAALTDPPLRFAWVERGNPCTSNPETPAVLDAFRALDFRVVVDQFMTDTAREADLVLPARSLLEQSDVIGAYWHPYVQLKPKVVEPPGEVRPESEVYRALAARLGLPADEVDARIPGPTDAEVVAWLERRLEGVPGLTMEALREGPVLPPGHQEVAFADLVFPTPSGTIELRSAEAAERWGVDALPSWEPPEEWGMDDGPAGRAEPYPLVLMTPNTKDRIHTQFGNLRMIRRHAPGPVADLSPTDARARGIADGDRIRIFNGRGSLEVPCRLDRGLRPGCVSLANGWWATDGAAVNTLSLGRETDLGHGAAFHDNRVEVERAGGR